MMLVEETTVPVSALPVATFKDHMRMGSGFSDDDIQDGVLEGFCVQRLPPSRPARVRLRLNARSVCR
jgi:hypothetical protein